MGARVRRVVVAATTALALSASLGVGIAASLGESPAQVVAGNSWCC